MRLAVVVSLSAMLSGIGAAGPGEPGGKRPRVVLRGARVSAPVPPRIAAVDLRALPVEAPWREGDPVRDEEADRGDEEDADRDAPGRTDTDAVLAEPREDPLLHEPSVGLMGLDPTFGTPLLSFAGKDFSGAIPGDPVGDVGPKHYVQATNGGPQGGTSFTVFNKTGAVISGPTRLGSLVAGGNCAGNGGDPMVVYDRPADRWVLLELSHAALSLCVYVSRGGDPVTSGWFRYEFNAIGFPDYPKLSVWSDGYYVSANDFGAPVMALERSRMLNGLTARSQVFTAPHLGGFNFQTLTPADPDGPTAPPTGAPAIFLRHRDDELHAPPGTPQDALELWEFHVDWDSPWLSTFSGPTLVPMAEFDSTVCAGDAMFACIPQPSGSNPLDTANAVVMWRPQYRNFGDHESLTGNFTVDATGHDVAGIRWFELRRTTNPPTPWRVWQEGTLSDGETHRWMGSAAQDGWGNLAVAYSVSSPTVPPGLRYAGRLAGATAGTLTEGEYTLVDGADSSDTSRWGDYASMSVDPVDDCTFWFTGQFAPGPKWRTWIGAFRFEYCGTPDFAVAVTPAQAATPGQAVLTLGVRVSGLNGFASPVTLSAAALPTGMSVSFDANPVTPAGSLNPGLSTMRLTVAKTVPPGLYTVAVRGTSGTRVHDGLVWVQVTMTALHDPALRVPSCPLTAACDSVSLLVGRAGLGPEGNAPNTLGSSCADGTGGVFHSQPSLDRLVVSGADGATLRQGRAAHIKATAWVSSTADRLDLYRAANASAPSWTYLTTLVPGGTGSQVLQATYTLPAGSRQAVRARFRSGGSPGPCGAGAYDDHDDLAFAVAPALP
jgi:hypothetical protein